MKKMIICIFAVFILAVAVIILCNYFSLPEHDRRKETELPDDNNMSYVAPMLDERAQEAIDKGQEYIIEEDGLNIPYSADLLFTLEKHFETDLEYQGAGLYRGTISENVSAELLLNPQGNVGRIQIAVTEQATEKEIKDAVARFVRFLNVELDESTVSMVVEEAVPKLQDLKAADEYIYWNYNVGFAGKVERNQLIIFTP